MAKAKPKVESSILTSIVEGFKKSALDLLNRTIHEKVKKIEKITVEIALGILFFTIGVFYLLKALVFFLNEFASISFTWGFLLVGVLSLGVASIFYFLIKHN